MQELQCRGLARLRMLACFETKNENRETKKLLAGDCLHGIFDRLHHTGIHDEVMMERRNPITTSDYP